MHHSPPPQPVRHCPTGRSVFRRRPTLFLLLLATSLLALATVWTAISPVKAQVAVELPPSVITATTSDLADRTGRDASSLGVARATNGQWNDASLGLPQPGEF